MLAEELVVIDGDSQLWRAARPLLDVALRLEQNDDSYSWHGWSKEHMNTFLKGLPPLCSLVLGVWETVPGLEDEGGQDREELRLGVVCEVVEGEVRQDSGLRGQRCRHDVGKPGRFREEEKDDGID